MEIKRFKNRFRNRIMHSRESYDGHEAMSAFFHVKAFMEIPSFRISERSRTPKICWRRGPASGGAICWSCWTD